ncbi:MAG: hypothetical protein ACK4HR_06685 [Hyphomonas sp.]|jgi:hypothetical protein
MTDTDDVRPPSTLPAFLSLFTSTGTLICCALPALLVSLGAGAVMAGLIETLPQIVWFGKHKGIVFGLAGALLLISGLWQWHARSLPCPADKAQAAACARARRISWIVWGLSVALFVTGFFFAFLAAGLFY